MVFWVAEKYQREVADAFVEWVPYVWGCYWFVRTNWKWKYIKDPVVEYVEGRVAVVSRTEDKICITYSRSQDSGIIRMRVNAILERYWLGRIEREKTLRVYYNQRWEVVHRNEWRGWGHYWKWRDPYPKRQKEQYLIFDIKPIEFTFIKL